MSQQTADEYGVHALDRGGGVSGRGAQATRIAKEAATVMLQHFTLAKWSLNKSLPRSNLHGDLTAIARKFAQLIYPVRIRQRERG